MGPTNSTRPLGEVLGARASNAGDIFHELWALRSALTLLSPGTELKALTVEGIASEEAAGARWGGVDCGLFFGADTMETAQRVELVQLKYSTSDPGRAWTVARLATNSAKKGNNSILRKLAMTYRDARSRMAAGSHLAIRLISNQPLSDNVPAAIADIHSDRDTDDARTLRAAAGLTGNELKKFFKTLDLSGTGSASRLILKEDLTSAVSRILEGDSSAEVRELQQQIRDLMLPGREREKVTLGRLLSWFGVSGLSNLLPVPADLRCISNPVPRVPTQKLLDAVNRGNRLVCVHGPAGCGKTTTLMQLPALLPEGSVSVVFDCYGAGRYTYSNDRRHLPENAFLQIANELALEQGTPFLVARSGRNPATIQSFLERVERAAILLSQVNSKSLLTILIDAADNSVAAAERSTPFDPCFIWELMDADLARLPVNVRFVLSSRTARRSKLHLPAGTQEIQCPPFTKSETGKLVRSAFPKATDSWIDQFHELSNGVPRVQDYALRTGATSQEAVLDALRPTGKELDTVLRELFAEASRKVGNAVFYDRCLAALAVLPAPIPIAHLAALCTTSPETIVDFVHDVQPALRLEQGAIAISDEDVEDFIGRESISQIPVMTGDICAYFANLYQSNPYAAAHYGDMLAKSGRAAEILPIIEDDLLPTAISDPIVRREVQLRRLLLALGGCRSAGNGPDILKVVLLSAEASKDEAALRNLLEKETDLSVRFARPSLMRLLLSDKDTYPDHGSIVVHDAARAAETGDLFTAREQLHAYDHWLRRRKEAKERSHDEWSISLDDLVARSEAIAILAGPKACKDDLFRWRPKSLRIQVAMRLVSLLIAKGRHELVRKAHELDFEQPACRLVFFVPLVLAGLLLPQKEVEKHLAALSERVVPDLRSSPSYGEDKWELSFLEIIVTACEIGFVAGAKKATLESALQLLLRHRRSPSPKLTYLDADAVDVALRAWLLLRRLSREKEDAEAFNKFLQEDNAPPPKRRERKKKDAGKQPRSRADDDLIRTVQTIFPIYVSRVDLLAEAATNGGVVKGDPAKVLKGVGHDAYYLDQRHWGSEFRRRIAQSVVRLMHLAGVTPEQLYRQAELLTKGESPDDYANRSYVVWQELLLRKSMHSTIGNAVARHAQEARDVRRGAEDRANALVKFSRLVLNFNQDDASALFQGAVEIAQEIDREALNQIDFVAALSSNLGERSPERWKPPAAAFASFVTDVAIRLEHEEHFPWTEAVLALSNLAPAVALAAIGQWQDEGVAGLHQTLPTWLEDAVEHQGQPPELSCALAILLRSPSETLFLTLATALAARLPESAAGLDMLGSDCLLHIPPGQREQIAGIILGVLPASCVGGRAIERLRAAISHNPRKSVTSHTTKPKKRLDLKIPPEFSVTTAQGLKGCIAWAISQEDYIPIESLLDQILESITSPAARIPFLNALADFDGDSLHANARAHTILKALELWKTAPAVIRWRKNDLPLVISDNLWPLSSWCEVGECQLVALLEAAGLAGGARIDAIAKGLERGAEKYSSGTLFGISEVLARALTHAEAAALLEWYVSRLHDRVPADLRDRFDAGDIPTQVNKAVGRFLLGQLSDIDLRVRWRAAHAVRRLVTFFGADPILSLFDRYDEVVDRSYRLSGAPYYWLAARLWSVIAAARVAQENPTACAALAPRLVAVALDIDFPHFLIRHYAKAAVEELLRVGAINLPVGEANTIRAINVPKLPLEDAPRRYERHLDRVGREEGRFEFDSLDTIPYWYSPLFELFSRLSADAFYAKLEEWLLDKWAVDPEANWWAKEPRRSRYSGRDFSLWGHSQGSRPTVERYGTYVEWHAMFCALGEWLETEPLAKGEFEMDRFEYWAARKELTEPPVWLSDRRSFTPLERNLECDLEGDDKHWFRRIPRTKFLEAVIGADRSQHDRLIVDGSWVAAQLTREVRTSIGSALVSPLVAAALVRTIDESQPYQSYLPYEQDSDDDVDSPPFQLKSWLRHLSCEARFDSEDPLRHDVDGLGVQPGERIRTILDLQEGPPPLSEWRTRSGAVCFIHESWADFGDAERGHYDTRRRVGSRGTRLRIDRAALKQFLIHENLDLIVKVRIERRLEEEYGRSANWEKEDKKKVVEKALLFRKDGTIEDRSGRVGTWTTTRKGV